MKKETKTENDELSDEELTARALAAAKDAFYKVIEAEGCEGAYWDVRFTAWLLTSDFKQRLTKVEIEYEVKETVNK